MSWLRTHVAHRQKWAEGLVSLRLDAELEPFEPGQWTNIALDVSGERIQRAYTLASAPREPPELFVASVPTGRFSPRLAALREGDSIEIDRKPQGFFTLRWVPEAEDLWLVASGTGLAPFVSMVRDGQVFKRFRRVVVVHGVREVAHHAYHQELFLHSQAHEGHLILIPVVSRDPDVPNVLHGRVTTALTRGELEIAAGVPLSPERSHVMLCGNPAMIEEMTALLGARGLKKHRQRSPGHVSSESFW
jgi:ferredoxin--NADP+ reductase